MKLHKLINSKKYRSIESEKFIVVTPFFLFWYLALFPGLLSFDPKVLLEMINRGESTNLWSGSYFWFIKYTSLNGREIFLTSFITLCMLTFSIVRLTYSFPLSNTNHKILLRCILATPLYGFTGVNISRDVFQCSAIIFLVSYGIRERRGLAGSKKDLVVGLLLFQFANIGVFIALCYLLILFFQRQVKLMLSVSLALLVILFISNWTIEKDSTGQFFSPLISDLKCVVQDADARITAKHLEYLFTLAPESIWQNPVSCSVADVTNISIRNPKTEISELVQFFSVYARIAVNNGPTIVMAHIQRSRGALPPPFFPGPSNQVNLDPLIPIGLNSNFALQDGAPVLHPSLDEKKYDIPNPISEVMYPIAQTGAFLINQASWFWGWGGFWLWPVLLATIFWSRREEIRGITLILLPLILTHVIYFLFAPSPSPRFYLGTVLTGLSMLLSVIIRELNKKTEASNLEFGIRG